MYLLVKIKAMLVYFQFISVEIKVHLQTNLTVEAAFHIVRLKRVPRAKYDDPNMQDHIPLKSAILEAKATKMRSYYHRAWEVTKFETEWAWGPATATSLCETVVHCWHFWSILSQQ